MVIRLAFHLFGLALLFVGPTAHALFPRTQQDLEVVEDRLRYEFGSLNERRTDRDPNTAVTPILVAPPQAHWEESRRDFAPSMLAVLSRVFPEPGALISCSQCYESRVFVANDSRTIIQNGELSLSDLARLREQPGYKLAKSVLITRETPSGIEMRLLAIDDGRILYTGVSDSTVTLDKAEPPLRLARELDRRKRGEALGYVNIDLGIYPQGLFALKFLEQWGSRNQHLSGIALSGYNPTGAIGLSYQYILPFRPQATIGAIGYYSLQGMFGSGSTDVSKALTAQGSLNYAISGSYGVFVAADTTGTLSVGLSLLNPVLFPFLL
jgi:hypothetical protein